MRDNAVYIDVSELEPPQPMTVILEALNKLPKGHFLVVNHRRKPVPLFSLLAEQDYCWRHQLEAEEKHCIFIWHKQDSATISMDIERLASQSSCN